MTPLAVLGTAAVTGIGLSSASAAAAIRCAIASFGEYGRAVDRLGEPAIVAAPPRVAEIRDTSTAIASMAVEALAQIIEPESAVPVFLALPEPRPGLDPDLAPQVAEAISERFPSVRVAKPSALGHASGGAAFLSAAAYLAPGRSDVGVVVGADSYLDPATIAWLDTNRQLHTTYNAWGFIPGAGAGACLVGTLSWARTAARRPVALVEKIALAEEKVPIHADGVCLGRALSQVVAGLTEGGPPGAVFDDFYCDLNGEVYRSDELGFMLSRATAKFRAPQAFVSPADCWGDLGAASLPLFVALAAEAGAGGYAAGPVSLLLAGSEGGLRAGLRVRTAGAAS